MQLCSLDLYILYNIQHMQYNLHTVLYNCKIYIQHKKICIRGVSWRSSSHILSPISGHSTFIHSIRYGVPNSYCFAAPSGVIWLDKSGGITAGIQIACEIVRSGPISRTAGDVATDGRWNSPWSVERRRGWGSTPWKH